MKKTLIASAVALAVLSSAGVSAQEVKLPQFYGNIQLAVPYVNTENGPEDYDLVDNGSTFGLTHQHEIMPGLTAFFKAEWHFDPTGDAGIGGTDEAYIGVKGDFGTILAGKDDSVYEWVDVTDLYEFLGVPGELDSGEDRQIQYISPDINGLKIGASLLVNGKGQKNAERDAFMLAAQYSLGDTTIALAFDNGRNAGNNNSYGLGVTHKLGDLTLAGQYEQREDVVDIFGLLGAYSLGQATLMASYHFSKWDAKGAEDTHTFSVQALYNLSSNFYTYVEGQYIDNLGGVDGLEENTLVLGATYVF